MADDLRDLFTYTLAIGLIVMSLVIGVFEQAGIGPAMSPPTVNYDDTSAITIISSPDGDSKSYDNNAGDIASVGFWSIVGGLRTMLLDFVPYCSRFNIPFIISGPAQCLIWLLFGYEMLQLKKIIWG